MGVLRILNALFRRSKISTQTVETPPSGSNFRYVNHEAIDENRGIRIRPVYRKADNYEDGRTYCYEEGDLKFDFCMEQTFETRELVVNGVPCRSKVQTASLIVEETIRNGMSRRSAEYRELKRALRRNLTDALSDGISVSDVFRLHSAV